MTAVWQLDATKARLADRALEAIIDLSQPSAGLSVRLGNAPSTAPLARMLGVTFGEQSTLSAATHVDAYVRGADLVATFDEAPPRRLRAQSYWRRLAPAEFTMTFAEHVIAAFDLILSVNTSLLDNDPRSNVSTVVNSVTQVIHLRRTSDRTLLAETVSPPAGKMLFDAPAGTSAEGSTGSFIIRSAGTLNNSAVAELSFIQMVHPVDLCRSSVATVANVHNASDETGIGADGVQIVHDLFHERLEKGVILRARVRAAIVNRHDDETTALAAYEQFAAAEPPLTV